MIKIFWQALNMFFKKHKNQKIEYLKLALVKNIEEELNERRNYYLYKLSEGYRNTNKKHRLTKEHFYRHHTSQEVQKILLKKVCEAFPNEESNHSDVFFALDIVNRSFIHQNACFFSWEHYLDYIAPNEDRMVDHERTVKYYNNLYKIATDLYKAKTEPDIQRQIKKLKAYNEPSLKSVEFNEFSAHKLSVTKYFGGNIFFDLVKGIANVLIDSLALIAGVFCIIPAIYSNTMYVGTVDFFIDLSARIIQNAISLVMTLAFPLAILYSKCTTNSYNVLKGKSARILDSLDELTTSTAEQATPEFVY